MSQSMGNSEAQYTLPYFYNIKQGRMPKDKRDIAHPFGGVGRWLPDQVGRLWNDVHSELHAMFDARSDCGWYALEYLGVDSDCYLEGDQVIANTRYGPRKPRDLYVHPISGLLLDAHGDRVSHRKHREEYHQSAVIDGIRLDNERSYELIKDIWYRKVFEYHDPAEIWQVLRFKEGAKSQAHKSLLVPGDTHTIYYREVPHQARIERQKFQCSRKERMWIDWFLAKARAGAIEVKWVQSKDRIDGKTTTLVVTHVLPSNPPAKRKKIRDTRLPHQGHPAPVARKRVEVSPEFSEKIFQEMVLPVVHRTAF